MPRVKYDRNALHRMLNQVDKSKKDQETKRRQIEREPSRMLKKVFQHCIRCGKTRDFSIDQLGFAKCTSCGSVAPERHIAVV